jgi:hypothetical protein
MEQIRHNIMFSLYMLSSLGSGVRRQGLALPIGSNLVDFYLKTETESSQKTKRWILSEKSIIILMYHRHKLLDLLYIFLRH